jgi:hypothetical protein
LHPETKHGGVPGKAGGGKKAKDAKLASFVKDTAKKTGKAKRTIARDVSRGEKIDPQALADLAGTCLDNGTELDALAKLPAGEQRSLAETAKRGEQVSAITTPAPADQKMSDVIDEGRSTRAPAHTNVALFEAGLVRVIAGIHHTRQCAPAAMALSSLRPSLSTACSPRLSAALPRSVERSRRTSP